MDEVDTLLDDSFVAATVEVLSHVNFRGVDASRNIDRRKEFVQEVIGEETFNEGASEPKAAPSPLSPPMTSSSSSPQEAVVDLAQLVLVGATLPVGFQRTLDRVVDTESLHRVTTPHLHRLSPHVNHKFFRVKPSLKYG